MINNVKQTVWQEQTSQARVRKCSQPRSRSSLQVGVGLLVPEDLRPLPQHLRAAFFRIDALFFLLTVNPPLLRALRVLTINGAQQPRAAEALPSKSRVSDKILGMQCWCRARGLRCRLRSRGCSGWSTASSPHTSTSHSTPSCAPPNPPLRCASLSVSPCSCRAPAGAPSASGPSSAPVQHRRGGG